MGASLCPGIWADRESGQVVYRTGWKRKGACSQCHSSSTTQSSQMIQPSSTKARSASAPTQKPGLPRALKEKDQYLRKTMLDKEPCSGLCVQCLRLWDLEMIPLLKQRSIQKKIKFCKEQIQEHYGDPARVRNLHQQGRLLKSSQRRVLFEIDMVRTRYAAFHEVNTYVFQKHEAQQKFYYLAIRQFEEKHLPRRLNRFVSHEARERACKNLFRGFDLKAEYRNKRALSCYSSHDESVSEREVRGKVNSAGRKLYTKSESKCKCFERVWYNSRAYFYRQRTLWLKKALQSHEELLQKHKSGGSEPGLVAEVEKGIKSIKRQILLLRFIDRWWVTRRHAKDRCCLRVDHTRLCQQELKKDRWRARNRENLDATQASISP